MMSQHRSGKSSVEVAGLRVPVHSGDEPLNLLKIVSAGTITRARQRGSKLQKQGFKQHDCKMPFVHWRCTLLSGEVRQLPEYNSVPLAFWYADPKRSSASAHDSIVSTKPHS